MAFSAFRCADPELCDACVCLHISTVWCKSCALVELICKRLTER